MIFKGSGMGQKLWDCFPPPQIRISRQMWNNSACSQHTAFSSGQQGPTPLPASRPWVLSENCHSVPRFPSPHVWTFKLCSHKSQGGKRGSTVALTQATGSTSGEEPSCQCRTSNTFRSSPWFGTILWRREWQPTSVFLPGESHRQRSLVGYSPWGHKRTGHDLAIKQ